MIAPVYSLFVVLQPGNLMVQQSLDTINTLFLTFSIEPTTLSTITALLRYDGYNYLQHYEKVEPLDRLNSLFPYIQYQFLHETLFSPMKLADNEPLARLIFLQSEHLQYTGRLLSRHVSSLNGELFYSFDNRDVYRATIKYAIQHQARVMHSLQWLSDFFTGATFDEALWLIDLLIPYMTVEILREIIRKFPQPDLVQRYFTFGIMTETDLLLRLLTFHLVEFTSKRILLSPTSRLYASDVANRLYDARSIRGKYIDGLVCRIFRPAALSSDVELDELFNLLTKALLMENNLSTWGLLASIVIAAERVGGITKEFRFEKACWLIREGSQFIYHFQLRELAYKSQFDTRQKQAICDILPVELLPGSKRTLKARVRAWIMEGPLAARNPPTGRFENYSSIPSFAMTAYLSGRLPTNFYLNKPLVDYRRVTTDGFGDGLVDSAFQFLKSKAIFDEERGCFKGQAYDIQAMVTVLASWPYLLFYKRKLDLGQFFPDNCHTDASIESFLVRIRANTCGGGTSLGKQVEHALMAFKIAGFLRPAELRSLIDESYVGCE